MNAVANQTPRPASGHQDAKGATYGACPNCDRTLHVAATGCPHCRAIFNGAAVWRVRPDASRMPDDETALLVPALRVRASYRRTAHVRAQAAHSLAGQLLEDSGPVTLEDHRHSFSVASTAAQAIFAWGCICVLLLILSSVSPDAFGTFFSTLLWLSPVAVLVLYDKFSEAEDKELALRKVVLDLAAGELTIEQQLIGETRSSIRRVPLADLRLGAHLKPVAPDADGFQAQRSPDISLLVPGGRPNWQTLRLPLLPANHQDHRDAAAIYAALLVHTGIAPMKG